MRTKAIDRFNGAAQVFAREALGCAAELRLIADNMERSADLAMTISALDFLPGTVQQRDEERVAGGQGAPGGQGDPDPDGERREVERGIARAFPQRPADAEGEGERQAA